jgi:hypothetical protein
LSSRSIFLSCLPSAALRAGRASRQNDPDIPFLTLRAFVPASLRACVPPCLRSLFTLRHCLSPPPPQKHLLPAARSAAMQRD